MAHSRKSISIYEKITKAKKNFGKVNVRYSNAAEELRNSRLSREQFKETSKSKQLRKAGNYTLKSWSFLRIHTKAK